MVGAGSVAFVATLANRRAFAGNGVACGPISAIGSLNPSQQNQAQCGGLTPGFWKTHGFCTNFFLGGSITDANFTVAKTKTLGQVLPALLTVDPTAAAMTFQQAFCNPSSTAFHWAGAILDALSPALNPHFGYTITTLNAAILKAFNAGVSAAAILGALETLENDFMTNDGGCAGGLSAHLCP